jgi:tetratricopeptide (TPR) repeat protein
MFLQNIRMLGVAIVCSSAAAAMPAWAGDMETCGDGRTLFEDAIVICTRVINSASLRGRSLAAAYTYRGRSYGGTGQYDRALADFAKAIAIDPSFGAPYSARGEVYYRQKDLDRAIAEYDMANAVDPKYPDAYAKRAIIYADRREYDRAISEWTKAIELDPKKDILWYMGRLALYSNKGEYERALDDADKVISLRPSMEFGYRMRARTLEKMGRKAEAIAEYRKLLSVIPNIDVSEDLKRLGAKP